MVKRIQNDSIKSISCKTAALCKKKKKKKNSSTSDVCPSDGTLNGARVKDHNPLGKQKFVP